MSEPAPTAHSPTPDPTRAAATTTRASLPADRFALAELFERLPDATVECESAVANPSDHALLVIRTERCEHEIDAALRSDSSVASVECFGKRPNEWRYRITWEGRPRQLIQRLVRAGVTLLDCRGRGGKWDLRLLAPDRDGIAGIYDILTDLECNADCRSVAVADGTPESSGMSPLHHETLTTARELGYYSIPRDITSSELAGELGVTHQALSERFRRAHRSLIETELPTTTEP